VRRPEQGSGRADWHRTAKIADPEQQDELPEAGIREVVKQLLQTPHKHLHIVFGQVNDKETGNILALLPKEATYYFCKANIPRGLDAIELKRQAMAAGLTGRSYGSVRRALAAALKAASSGDLVFVGGSTFVVAEVIH